jgi:hypothetical protein
MILILLTYQPVGQNGIKTNKKATMKNKKRLLNPVSLSVVGLLAAAVGQAAWSYGPYYWSQDSYVNPTLNKFEFACWRATGGFIEVYTYVDNGQYGPVIESRIIG